MGTDKVAFEEDRAEDRTVFFYHIFFPYFFPCINFPYFLFLYFFPRTIFPYFFKSLKSNVLKYQWVVFLVHIVTTQFMFLAGYPFKRHPYGFPWTGGVRTCAIGRDQTWIVLMQKRIEMFYCTNQSHDWKLNQLEVAISKKIIYNHYITNLCRNKPHTWGTTSV